MSTTSPTYSIRRHFVDIARVDRGRVEESKNQAPWIKKLWSATSYPEGFEDRAPYCAAGMAYCLKTWLNSGDVMEKLGLAMKDVEGWRCKSARAFDWEDWAQHRKLKILPPECILHTGDLVIYKHSHIEMVTDDDGTALGPFVAIGYNTNAAGSRDGEGCFEKPRSRSGVKCFIRIIE